jgi:hypothetical protein
MKDNKIIKLRSTKFFSSSRVHSFFSSLTELELYGRCFLLHPSCHHLQSEHVEMEGMDIPEVEGMNMVEKHNHPTNHRLGEEDMNMVKEHYHPTNHRLEVENMDMVNIHMVEVESMNMVEERPSNHRPEVEGIDRQDIDMWEDMTVEVEVVKREHEGVVLVRHWIGNGAKMHRQTH